MFTGLVETTAPVAALDLSDAGARLTVHTALEAAPAFVKAFAGLSEFKGKAGQVLLAPDAAGALGEVWFGLGAARTVDRLEVRWPSGTVQRWDRLAADRVLDLREGHAPTRLGPTDHPAIRP